jgi:uncharacterized protein involved in exopolysaccharide biosynthesis
MATATSSELSNARPDDLSSSGSMGHPEPGEDIAPDESIVPIDRTGDVIVRAIARHKLLVILLGIVLAAAGVGIGVARKPTYTATATLQVGGVNLNSPGFYGFVQSASDLATVFSQSTTAAPVLATIHSKLGLTPSETVQRLSAAPTPLSPSFHIIATGPSALSAVDLANTASAAVIAYETHSAQATSPQTAPLLAAYSRAAQTLAQAAATVTQLSSGSKTDHSQALLQAQAALDAARVRANALGASYQSALVSSGSNSSTGLVSLVAGAVTASSNRNSKIELFAFIGLVAGLVLGAVLAALYEQRRARRPYH